MSSTPTSARMDIKRAAALAGELLAHWEPVCERIEMAGSIRRRCNTVGDIELVCIPKEHSIFAPGLAGCIEEMLASGALKRGRCNGQKYQQYLLPKCDMLKVDLFLVTPENFGLIFAIRTGPWRYSREIVTQRRKGGLLRDDLEVSGGQLRNSGTGTIIPTPEEHDFLKKYANGWVDPHLRR